MSDERPDPDLLLSRVKSEEVRAERGALRIFFGYAAGVGKTYAMLEAARQARAQNRDVVVGYIQTHARPETQALVEGLEQLPVREIEYRGVTLREFDVDRALTRRPEVLLVDELAHSNAPGSRHDKRWQDVEELLAAGINVWTTLNVQHIESLNDVIGQITGVMVRETIPDRVFDAADELELIDLTPEALIDRLQRGKIYIPDQAERALRRFFQKANLSALRELSLRQAARRIHTEVEQARRISEAARPWATAERLLVCIGPSPTTGRVIRTAKRMAAALDAPWLAVSVDLTGDPPASRNRARIAEHFRLAEQLGAETVTLAGQNIAGTIIDYARSRNVTKIFVGKTNQSRWRRFLVGTVIDEILDQSGDIDVYVIHGEKEPAAVPLVRDEWSRFDRGAYAKAALVVACAACIAFGLRTLHFADSEANTVMLLLAGVALAAYRYGRGPAIFASLFAVLAFDFFFVPPYLTLAVANVQHVVTFAVMLAIGAVISTLTSRLRAQVESTRERERRVGALYELGKQLSALYGRVFLASAAGEKLVELLGGEVAIYLQPSAGYPEVVYGHATSIANHPVSLPAALWVMENDKLAGMGTNTLPNAQALFFPVIGSQRTHGAIGIHIPDPERLLQPDQRRLIEACAAQLALALERDQLAIDAAEGRIQIEAEQVRSSLLSSVSHDLRTPLAAIAGASSSLLESASLDEATRRQLLETVSDEASRLTRLLENILQMSKLESGAAAPVRQWHVLEDIVGTALERARSMLGRHHVAIQIPDDLPLVPVDGLLFEQVLVNLLENAAQHTPPGSRVVISAAIDGKAVRIAIGDDGPGIPAGDEERIFEKFYRAMPSTDGGRGSGLGLAICRAIVKSHGGTITAANRPGGGAEFVIRIPLPADVPQVVVE